MEKAEFKHGRWRRRVYVNGKRVWAYGRTKRDLNDECAKMRTAVLNSTYVEPTRGKITVEGWWNEWDPKRKDIKPGTRAKHATHTRHHIFPTFGGVPLRRLTTEALQEWVDRMEGELDLAPSTVHSIVYTLTAALKAAVQQKRIPFNPADGLELSPIEVREMLILTPQRIADLAANIDPRYSTWVWVAAFTGLRFGELAALRPMDIDFENETVRVVRTLVEINGHHSFGTPKTKKGTRTVPFFSSMLADLLREACEGLGPTDLVFTAPSGSLLQRSSFRSRFFNPACVAIGVGENWTDDRGRVRYRGFRPHDLRHTAISMWAKNTNNPADVARWAGHASVRTVYDRYVHFFSGSEDKVTAGIDEMTKNAVGVRVAPIRTPKRQRTAHLLVPASESA